MILLNSPFEALHAVAGYIRTTRLQQNVTMDDLAARSGISVATLSRIEKKGACSTEALVKVLTALGKIDSFIKSLTPDEDLSIAQLREMSLRKPKQRARRTA